MRGVEEVARGSVWAEALQGTITDDVLSFGHDFSEALGWTFTCDTWAGTPVADF
jgi:hypothetical protein